MALLNIFSVDIHKLCSDISVNAPVELKTGHCDVRTQQVRIG